MGKTGPCCHCGVTSTPLWRNGPPDKPVLCNACGSRWRTKGSLMNYTPLHARENFDLEESKISKSKNISLKAKQLSSHKKKQITIALESEHELRYSDTSFRKVVEKDVSNQSSSGSAVSYSESCAHVGTADASDITGSAQSNVTAPLVPSKKRTFLTRPEPSPVEKLRKDLYTILHEQQASNLSGFSEEDLIYESGTPIGSETAYGSVLIRPPYSKSAEEESEASSLSLDSKPHTTSEAYSASTYLPVRSASKESIAINVGTCNIKKPTAREVTKMDKLSLEILNMLLDRNSSLNSVHQNDLINFGVFMKYFTHEEQQLMKYLPSLDMYKPPESLEIMFKSNQFCEALSCFQQLLQEGFSYLSFSGDNVEQCRLMQRYMLNNLKISEWAEAYEKLKMIKGDGSATRLALGAPKSTSLKRPNDIQKQNPTDLKFMRCPKRACKYDAPRIAPSRCSSQLISFEAGSKLTEETDDLVDNEGTCFSPMSLFASSPDRGASMLNPSQFTMDNSDNDVLLDVPSNASLAEAVLLCSPSKDKTKQNDSLMVHGAVDRDESLSNFPSSFTNKQAKYK